MEMDFRTIFRGCGQGVELRPFLGGQSAIEDVEMDSVSRGVPEDTGDCQAQSWKEI